MKKILSGVGRSQLFKELNMRLKSSVPFTIDDVSHSGQIQESGDFCAVYRICGKIHVEPVDDTNDRPLVQIDPPRPVQPTPVMVRYALPEQIQPERASQQKRMSDQPMIYLVRQTPVVPKIPVRHLPSFPHVDQTGYPAKSMEPIANQPAPQKVQLLDQLIDLIMKLAQASELPKPIAKGVPEATQTGIQTDFVILDPQRGNQDVLGYQAFVIEESFHPIEILENRPGEVIFRDKDSNTIRANIDLLADHQQINQQLSASEIELLKRLNSLKSGTKPIERIYIQSRGDTLD